MIEYKTINDIYAQIPYIKCKQQCQLACGPILLSPIEQKIIDDNYGITDFSLESAVKRKCLACPKLSNGKCTIYEHRPLVCRLYGTVKKMRCRWGCRPKKWLNDEKARELIKAAHRIAYE